MPLLSGGFLGFRALSCGFQTPDRPENELFLPGHNNSGMITHIFSYLSDFWTGFQRRGGLKGSKWRLAGLSISPSYKISDSWSGLRRETALTWGGSCHYFLHQPVSVPGVSCIKSILYPNNRGITLLVFVSLIDSLGFCFSCFY